MLREERTVTYLHNTVSSSSTSLSLSLLSNNAFVDLFGLVANTLLNLTMKV
jgi:hypothetical protein